MRVRQHSAWVIFCFSSAGFSQAGRAHLPPRRALVFSRGEYVWLLISTLLIRNYNAELSLWKYKIVEAEGNFELYLGWMLICLEWCLLDWALHSTLKGFRKSWQLNQFQCFVNMGEWITGQTLTLFCLWKNCLVKWHVEWNDRWNVCRTCWCIMQRTII